MIIFLIPVSIKFAFAFSDDYFWFDDFTSYSGDLEDWTDGDWTTTNSTFKIENNLLVIMSNYGVGGNYWRKIIDDTNMTSGNYPDSVNNTAFYYLDDFCIIVDETDLDSVFIAHGFNHTNSGNYPLTNYLTYHDGELYHTYYDSAWQKTSIITGILSDTCFDILGEYYFTDDDGFTIVQRYKLLNSDIMSVNAEWTEWQDGDNHPSKPAFPSSVYYGGYYQGNTNYSEGITINSIDLNYIQSTTATTTYPTWDYGTFDTAFLDYQWSSTTTDITVDFQIDVSELSIHDRDFYIDALSFCYYEITATSSSNLIACPIYPLDPELNWFATTTQQYSQFLDIPILADGDYTAEISFYSITDIQKTMQGITNIYIDFTVSGGIVTVEHMGGVSNNLTPPELRKYKKCDIYNIDNCILNALNFAFIPSSDYFTNWLTVWESLSTSFPFQYLTEILNIFNNETDISADETAHNLTVPVNFGNGTSTMTLLNTDTHIENNQYLPNGMFAFIRNLLGLSVWFAMIFYIVGRIKSINLKLL